MPKPRSLVFLVGLLFCFVLCPSLHADTINGTVKDPSSAVVAGARLEITGEGLAQPIVLTSDDTGKFTSPNLNPGKYSVRVTKDGFDPFVTQIELKGSLNLDLTLKIAEQVTSVNVNDKSLAFANSDSAYRQLRELDLGASFVCEKYVFNMDVGSFELKSGTLTFLKQVNGMITGAIFVGQGHFTLKPVTESDTREMEHRSGHPTAEEEFTEGVFRFSGRIYQQLVAALTTKVDTPAQAASVFQHWRSKMRHRHEIPESFTQAVLEDENIDNVDADVLATLYNPKHPQFFNAYMTGSPHKDLRFFVRLRVGAIPQIDSPEEVGLINYSGGGMDDGIGTQAISLAS